MNTYLFLLHNCFLILPFGDIITQLKDENFLEFVSVTLVASQ